MGKTPALLGQKCSVATDCQGWGWGIGGRGTKCCGGNCVEHGGNDFCTGNEGKDTGAVKAEMDRLNKLKDNYIDWAQTTSDADKEWCQNMSNKYGTFGGGNWTSKVKKAQGVPEPTKDEKFKWNNIGCQTKDESWCQTVIDFYGGEDATNESRNGIKNINDYKKIGLIGKDKSNIDLPPRIKQLWKTPLHKGGYECYNKVGGLPMVYDGGGKENYSKFLGVYDDYEHQQYYFSGSDRHCAYAFRNEYLASNYKVSDAHVWYGCPIRNPKNKKARCTWRDFPNDGPTCQRIRTRRSCLKKKIGLNNSPCEWIEKDPKVCVHRRDLDEDGFGGLRECTISGNRYRRINPGGPTSRKRAFEKYLGTGYSIADCAMACSDYDYYGIQNNEECYCSNNLRTVKGKGKPRMPVDEDGAINEYRGLRLVRDNERCNDTQEFKFNGGQYCNAVWYHNKLKNPFDWSKGFTDDRKVDGTLRRISNCMPSKSGIEFGKKVGKDYKFLKQGGGGFIGCGNYKSIEECRNAKYLGENVCTYSKCSPTLEGIDRNFKDIQERLLKGDPPNLHEENMFNICAQNNSDKDTCNKTVWNGIPAVCNWSLCAPKSEYTDVNSVMACRVISKSDECHEKRNEKGQYICDWIDEKVDHCGLKKNSNLEKEDLGTYNQLKDYCESIKDKDKCGEALRFDVEGKDPEPVCQWMEQPSQNVIISADDGYCKVDKETKKIDCNILSQKNMPNSSKFKFYDLSDGIVAIKATDTDKYCRIDDSSSASLICDQDNLNSKTRFFRKRLADKLKKLPK